MKKKIFSQKPLIQIYQPTDNFNQNQMSFEYGHKKSFFDGAKMTEKNIQKILSQFIQNSESVNSSCYASRRTSHTYDITMNKENFSPDKPIKNVQTKKGAQHQFERISTFQIIYKTAVQEYNQAFEQGQMLIEDLNAKLLERAEFISQREDMDQLLEQQMNDNNVEYEYATNLEDVNSKQQIQIKKLFDLKNTLEKLYSDRALINKQQQVQNSEKLSLLYVDITGQIQRIQNKVAIEQKISNYLHSQSENLKSSLTKNIIDSSKQAFQEYLSNQHETFKKLKQCYGPELYKQIILEHRQQLESLLNSQYSQKIHSIQLMQKQHQNIQNLIKKNVNFVDNNLAIDIDNIRQIIDLKRDVMYQLKKTLQQKDIAINEMNPLQQKVESLEKEKLQLEHKVIQMALKMEIQSKRYIQSSQQRIFTAEKIYGEILDDSSNSFDDPRKIQISSKKSSASKTTSSQKKQRSYSEINQIRQLQKTQKSDLSESLILSQIHDLSNLRASDSLDRASADDSLMQHIQDLNSTIQQQTLQKDPRRTLNMPLQQIQKNQTFLSLEDDSIERLQTIAEEQLSINRQEEDLKFKFKILTQQPQNTILNDDSNTTTKKNQFIMTLQQPITNKGHKNYHYIHKEITKSEQVMKYKKSKSVDSGNQVFSQTQKQDQHKQEHPKQNLTQVEKNVLKTIQPLLLGVEIYKKFSNLTQLKKEEYNSNQQQNPTSYGYGNRIMVLSSNLESLEFRNPSKMQVCEQIVKIDQIMRSVIPNHNKYQRPNDYLSMSLIVQKIGKIELLMPGDQCLQQWFLGLQFIKVNQRIILSIKKKLTQL